MIDDFAKDIKQYETNGYRWVSMGAGKVIMTNGNGHWLVGAKYTGEWVEFIDQAEAEDVYRKIANPYWEHVMEAADVVAN